MNDIATPPGQDRPDLRIHFLQHVPFEDAANIGRWASERGHQRSLTRLFAAEPLASIDSFDWLVVMGGPMNVYEHQSYPWLTEEKQFIEQAIARKKIVLGVCFGAQLAADVLGGKVRANGHREIGWFPVSLTETGSQSPLFAGFPPEFLAFHWHGDTFDLPPGALRLAGSDACANQAFQYQQHVIGLQFHLDYSLASIEKMLRHCADELTDEPFVQRAEEILRREDRVTAIRGLLYQMLENLAAIRL